MILDCFAGGGGASTRPTMCSCNRSREFYRFPAMAKLDEWTNAEQMICIMRERREADVALEVLDAVSPYTAPEDIALRRRDYGMELMDIIHATETALRMEFTPEEVAELRDAVEKKNRERGYYG